MLRPALILAAALLSVLWMGPLRAEEEKVSRFVEIIAPLIDPAKLDTLAGKRAATPRLRKACHWLEKARRDGVDLGKLIEAAQAATGSQGTERSKGHSREPAPQPDHP